MGNKSSIIIFKNILKTNWGHASVILSLTSSLTLHLYLSGNFEFWTLNPYDSLPIGHSIVDPHFGFNLSYFLYIESLSGIYNFLYTIEIISNNQILTISFTLQIITLS